MLQLNHESTQAQVIYIYIYKLNAFLTTVVHYYATMPVLFLSVQQHWILCTDRIPQQGSRAAISLSTSSNLTSLMSV